MWKSKKAIPVMALVIAVLVGSTAGVAFAQTPSADQTQTKPSCRALLDRVCEIYKEKTGVAIDAQQLKDAFTQAQREMRDQALYSWLQRLVDQGKITPEQKQQYEEWWDARPDTPLPTPFGRGFGCRGFRGGIK